MWVAQRLPPHAQELARPQELRRQLQVPPVLAGRFLSRPGQLLPDSAADAVDRGQLWSDLLPHHPLRPYQEGQGGRQHAQADPGNRRRTRQRQLGDVRHLCGAGEGGGFKPVFDEVIWLRLRAGHSHNEADAWHRRAMAVFYPNSKHGPGCASPFEYQAKLIDGLSGMSGGCEILWQLANFNFEEWCKGCVTPEFGHYAAPRAWRFEYDEKLPEHGCVRVTFKDKLTDEATGTTEEWKPLVPAAADSLMAFVT